MKKAIIKSATLGATIGFLLAILYAIIFLISLELAIPLDAPSVVVIFTAGFFDFEFPFLLQSSPFWLLVPTLVGALISAFFTYLRYKLKMAQKMYIFLCLLISFGFILPGISLYLLQLHNLYFASRYFGAIQYAFRLGFPPVLFLNLLFLYPNIIFLLASLYMANYISHRFQSSTNDTSLTP